MTRQIRLCLSPLQYTQASNLSSLYFCTYTSKYVIICRMVVIFEYIKYACKVYTYVYIERYYIYIVSAVTHVLPEALPQYVYCRDHFTKRRFRSQKQCQGGTIERSIIYRLIDVVVVEQWYKQTTISFQLCLGRLIQIVLLFNEGLLHTLIYSLPFLSGEFIVNAFVV